MSLFRNVISKLGNQVQQTAETVAETVGQTVGQTVSKRVSQSLDAALSSRLGSAVGEAWQKTMAGVTPGLPAALPAWTPKEFEKQVRNRLKAHTGQHPFVRRLQAGQLNQTQVHVWLANEWYFQQNLALKDAAILSNCEDATFRRLWTRRLLEQDGGDSGHGAVEHWARLAASLGLETDILQDMTLVTPGVRFAVDTYINFARRAPWTEAVCASLSELLLSESQKTVLDSLSQHYGKPDAAALQYFSERPGLQRKDWDTALAALNDYFKSREDQDYALDILQFKQDILWTCLDSISLSPLAQTSQSGDDPIPAVKGESPQRTRRKKASRSAGKAEPASDKSGDVKAKKARTTAHASDNEGKSAKADRSNKTKAASDTSPTDGETRSAGEG